MTNRLSVLILLVLSVLLIEETIRLQLPYLLFENGDLESMEAGHYISPGNSEIVFGLAKAYHNVFLEDDQKVLRLYAESLNTNPLLASTWLEMSEVFMDRDDNKNALLALSRAKEIAPFSIARLWQGSILALRLDDRDLAFDNFKIVALGDPDMRYRVYETSWLVYDDPDFILDELIEDELLYSYIDFLITEKKADASLAVWDRMTANEEVEPDIFFMNYMNFLIDNKKSRHAYAIWSKIIGERESESLIWNGDFDKKLLGAGFGWREVTDNKKGFAMTIDNKKSYNGERSFNVKFDGSENADFYHLFQIVPVEQNQKYLLTAKINTKDITTRSGVRIESYCYPNYQTMSKSTEPLTGTNDWTEVSLNLDLPQDCDDLLVRIRRFGSSDFDNYISGDAWLDEVRLIKQGNG